MATAKKASEAVEVEAPSGPVVTAPLVSVLTKSGARRDMHAGDFLGEDVAEESVEHLKSLGYISK